MLRKISICVSVKSRCIHSFSSRRSDPLCGDPSPAVTFLFFLLVVQPVLPIVFERFLSDVASRRIVALLESLHVSYLRRRASVIFITRKQSSVEWEGFSPSMGAPRSVGSSFRIRGHRVCRIEIR